jgi:hypothetical protein
LGGEVGEVGAEAQLILVEEELPGADALCLVEAQQDFEGGV